MTSALPPVLLDRTGLEALIQLLRADDGIVRGPTVRDGAIVIDEVDGIADLPEGRGDEQDAGRYRLTDRGDAALFGYAVGPHSPKAHLFPARTLLVRTHRRGAGFEVEVADDDAQGAGAGVALMGVRPCELRAMEVQDLVFASPDHADPTYTGRRAGAVVVVAQCTDPAATCFCTSMGGGPRAASGFDLALTEILDGGQRFVVEVGSERGRELIERVPHRPAEGGDVDAARSRTDAAAAEMTRRVDAGPLQELLASTLEHPRWDDVASRCLSCASCTMVCPTCFCSSVEDTTDLTGDHAERWRRWDSCFTLGHSELHGGAVHGSTRSRYRQWLTHKFGTWHDQFGVSGCVGCGRCIAWCPVGIDVTVELAALAVDPAATPEQES